MEKILVSACLLGSHVRYNGSCRLDNHPVLTRWQAEGRVVQICPEVAAGFSTPRPPAEIRGTCGAVLRGHRRCFEFLQEDVEWRSLRRPPGRSARPALLPAIAPERDGR